MTKNRADIEKELEGAVLKIPPDVEYHEIESLYLWIDENGIVCTIARKAGKRTLDRVKKSIEVMKKFAGEEKLCMLVDSTHSSENTLKAREYASKELPEIMRAVAVLSGSALGKMVANIYVKISSQPYPIKFFKSEEKAKAWLKKFL